MPTPLELAKLRRAYGEIRQGFSVVKAGKDDVYVKHLSSIERGSIDAEYIVFFETASERGLFTEADRLKELESKGEWLPSDEKSIEDLKQYLRGLRDTKANLLIPSQLEGINKQIADGEGRLIAQLEKRHSLLGFTAEEFANKKLNELYIFHSMFKSEKFDELYISREDMEYMNDYELGRLIDVYNSKMREINDTAIKKIAIARFFQDLYSLCEKDIFKFFGKPIADLTYYQCDLAQYARFFYFILSEQQNKPPIEMLDDPEKIIEWYNISKNATKELERHKPAANNNGGTAAQSLMGVSQKEYKQMGMESHGPSLSDIAKKNGDKKIGREQLMALLSGQKV